MSKSPPHTFTTEERAKALANRKNSINRGTFTPVLWEKWRAARNIDDDQTEALRSGIDEFRNLLNLRDSA